MLKRFLLMLATVALLGGAGQAAAQIDIGTTTPPATSPDYAMPPGKIYIDTRTMIKPRAGVSTKRYVSSCTGAYDTAPCTIVSQLVPDRYTGTPSGFDDQNGGSFRVQCDLSHMAFDDPIVWPGQAGRTHLHRFFGNTSTRSNSDIANMATSGNSTCFGGTLNRSGYWVPTFVYHRPGNARDGEVQGSEFALFYYKVAQHYGSNDGGFGGTPVQWPPSGFRMITGNPNNTAPQPTNRFFFDCFKNGSPLGSFPAYRFDHIPTTAESNALGGCDSIDMSMVFPQCWDGVNLMSPGSPSTHVAWVDFEDGCQGTLTKVDGTTTSAANFPVLFPEIALNVHTNVVSADLDYLRLSSDLPRSDAQALGGNCTSGNNWCAGRSIHGDWVNGWSPDIIPEWGMSVTDAIIKECYMRFNNPAVPYSSDCHAHLLGSPETSYGAGPPGTAVTTTKWWWMVK